MLKAVSSIAAAAKAILSSVTTGLLQIVGPSDGTTRTMTVPDANFTAARVDASQTFNGAQAVSAPSANVTTTGAFAGAQFAIKITDTINNNGFAGTSYPDSDAANYGWTAGAQRGGGGGSSDFVWRMHVNSSIGTRMGAWTYQGDFEVSTPGKGIKLVSPNGLVTKTVTIDNAGNITLI